MTYTNSLLFTIADMIMANESEKGRITSADSEQREKLLQQHEDAAKVLNASTAKSPEVEESRTARQHSRNFKSSCPVESEIISRGSQASERFRNPLP